MTAPGRRTVVHVHLDHGREPRPASSAVSDPGGVYGYQWAEELSELRFSTSHAEGRATRFARRALKRALGFDLVHAVRNRAVLSQADVVWTHTEREHLALGLLVRLRLLPELPTIAQSVWLWESWTSASPLWRSFVRWVQHPQTLPTTLSPVNAAIGSAALGVVVRCVPYGVDQELDVPVLREPSATTPQSGVRAVALGNDRDRDWQLMRAVLDQAPEVRLAVLSGRRAARRAFRGAGARARVYLAEDRREVLQAYRDADVVAVPLSTNAHASGISTAFEALLAGRPLVVSDTGGLRDYLDDLAHYASPGDAAGFVDALREAVRSGCPTPEAARSRLAERGLRGVDYAFRHVWLSHLLLGTATSDESAVTAFRAVPVPPGLSTAGAVAAP